MKEIIKQIKEINTFENLECEDPLQLLFYVINHDHDQINEANP